MITQLHVHVHAHTCMCNCACVQCNIFLPTSLLKNSRKKSFHSVEVTVENLYLFTYALRNSSNEPEHSQETLEIDDPIPDGSIHYTTNLDLQQVSLGRRGMPNPFHTEQWRKHHQGGHQSVLAAGLSVHLHCS